MSGPTFVLLEQLHSSEQHSSVLRVCDVQFIQIFLLKQLERVQILVAIKKEGGEMLLLRGGGDAKADKFSKIRFEQVKNETRLIPCSFEKAPNCNNSLSIRGIFTVFYCLIMISSYIQSSARSLAFI